MAFPLLALLPVVEKVFDKIFPDKEKAAEAKMEMFKLQQAGELAVLDKEAQIILAQLEVNKTEAASSSLFVSGWRPFVGWVCGSGLAFQFLIAPLATWIATLAGHPVEFPSLDMGTLMTLLAGMLGLGGLRTYEKEKGVARS